MVGELPRQRPLSNSVKKSRGTKARVPLAFGLSSPTPEVALRRPSGGSVGGARPSCDVFMEELSLA